MDNEFKKILKELLIDTYTRTVNDNKEDFDRVYVLVWKMATMLVSKKIINMDEMKEMTKIIRLEDQEMEMKKWLEKLELED